MVQRIKKRSRKYLGKRRWGVGNIKNNRGSGSKGGVGKGGKKHKWTWTIVYARDTIGKVGFEPWHRKKLDTIDLDDISKRSEAIKEEKPTVTLSGYKVLSDGTLTKATVVKASDFSKKAMEKIKEKGGEAIKL